MDTDPFVATLSRTVGTFHVPPCRVFIKKNGVQWMILTRFPLRRPCTCTARWRRDKCPRIASRTLWFSSPFGYCCSLCARSRRCSRRGGTAPCPATPPDEACSATWRTLCSPRRKAVRLASTARTWSFVSPAAPSFYNTHDTVIYHRQLVCKSFAHAATVYVSRSPLGQTTRSWQFFFFFIFYARRQDLRV